MTSSSILRLRQICLAAPALEPAVDAVRAIFGVEVCHRDEAVGAYGLANALFVFGHQFLEIVAPTRPDTTAGRFIERSGGPGGRHGGYMAIFDTSDPERRRELVTGLGIRIAHVMDYPGRFFGIQLHPRDARATMLEFDRSEGNAQLDGAYWPAGGHWRDFQRIDRVRGIPWIDVHSPEPGDLAAHWGRIADVPVGRDGSGHPALHFDVGAARFVSGAGAGAGDAERLDTLHVEVDDASRVRSFAATHGLPVDGDGFLLCGVRIVPHTIAT